MGETPLPKEREPLRFPSVAKESERGLGEAADPLGRIAQGITQGRDRATVAEIAKGRGSIDTDLFFTIIKEREHRFQDARMVLETA